MGKRIVSKFGGTSMGDATCMLRSARIVAERRSLLTAVSATSGTTNQLIELAQLSQKGATDSALSVFEKIQQRHLGILQELIAKGVPVAGVQLAEAQLLGLFGELKSLMLGIGYLRDCSPRALDALVGIGERSSSVLFTLALQKQLVDLGLDPKLIELVDARTMIITDMDFGKARPLPDRIASAVRSKLKLDGSRMYVTQGYIGASVEGTPTTLGRGGSDYSAALFAEAVGAEELEIWTDVAGINTTDPRIVKQAKSIPEISFKEASELAVFGAKVLHPATLLPAIRCNIPTFVGSSFAPEQAGTWIRREVSSAPLVRALALRKKQALLTISTPEMLNAYGFLARIFEIFNRHQVSVDAITTSEISVAMTVEESVAENEGLLKDLGGIADVSVERDLALVSIIGNSLHQTPGLVSQVAQSLTDVRVRMLGLGASRHNFCFLVESSSGEQAIQRLHQHFIT